MSSLWRLHRGFSIDVAVATRDPDAVQDDSRWGVPTASMEVTMDGMTVETAVW